MLAEAVRLVLGVMASFYLGGQRNNHGNNSREHGGNLEAMLWRTLALMNQVMY